MPIPAPPGPAPSAPTAAHPEQERPAEPPEAPEPPPPPERPLEPPLPLPGEPPEPGPPLPTPSTDRHPAAAAARRAPGPARLAAALLAASLLSLPGCTTPSTTLRNPRTGQVVSCGGNVSSSLAEGMLGYSIQKSSDRRCVEEHTRLGFVPVR